MSGLKIIFAGTPVFAAEHLQAIINDGKHQVVAVYSQPDRRVGRGKKLQATPVKVVAEQANIPVLQPLSLKDADSQQALKDFNADIMVVVAYGMLLPKAVLNTPRLGCINVHASLLPRWRGAAPIERCLAAGDQETGVTIMQMDVGLDTGDMLLKTQLPISIDDTGASLRQKLSEQGCPALLEALEKLQTGSLSGEVQDDSLANYAHKLSKAEAALDWHLSAQQLALKIRAFNDSNVCYGELAGERVKFWQAQAQSLASTTQAHSVGTIVSADKNGIVVQCGEGQLVATEIQLPGAKRLDVAAVLNSKKSMFEPGNSFTNLDTPS